MIKVSKAENIAGALFLIFILVICGLAIWVSVAKRNTQVSWGDAIAELDLRVTTLENAPTPIPAAPTTSTTTVVQEISEKQIAEITKSVISEVTKYQPVADCISVSEPGAKTVTWSCIQRD